MRNTMSAEQITDILFQKPDRQIGNVAKKIAELHRAFSSAASHQKEDPRALAHALRELRYSGFSRMELAILHALLTSVLTENIESIAAPLLNANGSNGAKTILADRHFLGMQFETARSYIGLHEIEDFLYPKVFSAVRALLLKPVWPAPQPGAQPA